ncbi:MAG: bifunctional phosphoribosylaminoimidazolecarboxamide formyltransferase/IMP cyclohydrolase [Geminicoccaceae bacterium]
MSPSLPRRALLSVFDKTGLVELARALAGHGVELVSTGGTARALREAGLAVTDVSTVSGRPEILDGRVKTLQPEIQGGILARRADPAHMAVLAEHGIATIDLVVVNLYPFARTLASGADFATCIENIDIGGPAMIRAAAKNHEDVAILTDPADYPRLVEALARGGTDGALRQELARKAFAHTAAYDAAIASWLAGLEGPALPDPLLVAAPLQQTLRYGENPHQAGGLYAWPQGRPGVAMARQLQGKELSYNNFQDADAAVELVAGFVRPTVVIVKHTNPCGVASAATLHEAWERARAADPVSAFGGIVASNRPIDAATAEGLAGLFLEVVVAPGFAPEALERLAAKANLRLLALDRLPGPGDAMLDVRSIGGGLLAQARDTTTSDPASWETVTKRAPTAEERAALAFAWTVCRQVRSNAIVVAAGETTLGIGGGQTSRVLAVELACRDLRPEPAAGPLVLASDAFFPVADGIERAAAAGIRAVVQPGGSLRDGEVIAACDAHDIAMVTTGRRHFKH